ncbi:formylmethanofuran dehydrogenase subunit C [Trinickia sp. EG282A]|uniref:formylmethanofuran dehydrogenase subunit C n=1 Tax=Trinickia sp. EG282A TaxID=3237013 RepID=UPI0034D23C5D
MSTTILRVKASPPFPVDGSPLTPERLDALPLASVERLALRAGSQTLAVADLFDVSRTEGGAPATTGAHAGGAAAPAVVMEGDARWLDRLGAGVDAGTITVRGAIGDYAGAQMRGGTLTIEGDAGDFVGCEMRGGRLAVAGDCGDFAAGARAGEMEGMTGGTLTIGGSAGQRLADRMRRGLVLVGGDCGAFAASRLVAGTICIGGRLGAHYAYGMRRGTLVLATRPAALPATFVEGGRGFEVFWALFVRSLATAPAPFSRFAANRLPTRYAGDLAVDGRGEILIVE